MELKLINLNAKVFPGNSSVIITTVEGALAIGNNHRVSRRILTGNFESINALKCRKDARESLPITEHHQSSIWNPGASLYMQISMQISPCLLTKSPGTRFQESFLTPLIFALESRPSVRESEPCPYVNSYANYMLIRCCLHVVGGC